MAGTGFPRGSPQVDFGWQRHRTESQLPAAAFASPAPPIHLSQEQRVHSKRCPYARSGTPLAQPFYGGPCDNPPTDGLGAVVAQHDPDRTGDARRGAVRRVLLNGARSLAFHRTPR